MDDKKKYNFMENVLNKINKYFISLSDAEVKRNNKILESILTTVVNKMKETDPLFKAMYSRVFYGGSYYDGLKVGKPEEFDLDLLLSLPKYAQPVLTTSDIPGFVHLKIENYDGFMRQPEALPSYQRFNKLFDDNYFLDTQKVLSWMEGVVSRTFNDISRNPSKINLKHENDDFEITFRKGGPALTLKVSGLQVVMDVDLVTCFVFHEDKWPKDGFRSNPVETKPDFFIVPKKPKTGNRNKPTRYWRLSFQEQERVLMDNKKTLKPTIKLLKKLRDNSGHSVIASYYIKMVALQIAETKDKEFWKNSLSYVFMTFLKEYEDYIEKGEIPYYWNKNNNLLGNVKPTALVNIANRLKIIIKNVETKTDEPCTIAKYLLNKEDYNQFMMQFMKL